jgi:hypothetical protein
VMIHPDAERFIASRVKAVTTTVGAGHVAFFSHSRRRMSSSKEWLGRRQT